MAPAQSKLTSQNQRERVYYLDNFRTYLTALVIYHHVAVPYGGLGSWLYSSKLYPPGSSIALSAFNALNKSYFMGSFFFPSGYFSSRALKRKGAKSFLKTKFIKLGVPLVVYTLLAGPAQIAILKLYNKEVLGCEILTDYWKALDGVKRPIWFSGLLLIFDSIAALCPSIPQFLAQSTTLPSFILVIGAGCLIRLVNPTGAQAALLNLRSEYLPQYLASYILGASLESPPTPPISKTTRNVLIASTAISSTALLGLQLNKLRPYSANAILGGSSSLPGLTYALWNETTGYLLGTTILKLFRTSKRLNKSWGTIGRYSYAAFLVHLVVCVAAQVWTENWEAWPVVKASVLGTASVVGSWGVGWALVHVPGFGSVLL
ncbi:hypothetical protein V496_09138 [Pseudogymnoascus sp. VKM F-4515 (FW-2607)]|nr:hypothetical protein V496_09138 [Pseudogymnoascus sp. VKM F-4515 (FW-2607)]